MKERSKLCSHTLLSVIVSGLAFTIPVFAFLNILYALNEDLLAQVLVLLLFSYLY